MRNLAKKFEFGVTLSGRNFETVFSKSENTEFLLQKKNVMVLKFCIELDISTADGKLIKVIKKV
jgi:hypothetical protein